MHHPICRRALGLLLLAACAPPADDDAPPGETDADRDTDADTGTPSADAEREIAVVVWFSPTDTLVDGGATVTRPGTYTVEEQVDGSCTIRVVHFAGGGPGDTTYVPGGDLVASVGDVELRPERLGDGAWSSFFDPIDPGPTTVEAATSGDVAPAFTATAERPSDVVLDGLLSGTVIPKDAPLTVTFPAGTSGTVTMMLGQGSQGRYTTLTCTADVADGRLTVGTGALAFLDARPCQLGDPPDCVTVDYGVANVATVDVDGTWTGRLIVAGTVSGPGGGSLTTELVGVAERVGIAP